MGANHSRWSWVGVTGCCLALTALTGCKSGFKAPSADWLSWTKPKPAANSLTSAPRKPSVGALPNPSATTAGAASPYGQTGFAQNATGQSGYGGRGTTGYQTGPYNTGSAGGYPSASSGIAGAQGAGAAGPYRSPYQAAQDTSPRYNTGAGYGVADTRGAAGYQASPAASGSGNQSWNSDAYRRGGDTYGGGQAAASPYGSTQATSSGQTSGNTANMSYPQARAPYASSGYDANVQSGYQQPAAYQQAPQGSSSTATHAYASDTGDSAYPTTSPSSYESSSTGTCRPGSTSRDTGALSSPTSASSSANAYPTAGGAAPATANQSWSYGDGGQYQPTGGQY